MAKKFWSPLAIWVNFPFPWFLFNCVVFEGFLFDLFQCILDFYFWLRIPISSLKIFDMRKFSVLLLFKLPKSQVGNAWNIRNTAQKRPKQNIFEFSGSLVFLLTFNLLRISQQKVFLFWRKIFSFHSDLLPPLTKNPHLFQFEDLFLLPLDSWGWGLPLQLLRFTGESRWASKRRFLLNRRFTTFALTSALGKVIYFFTVMNFYEVWVWCLRTIWHLRFFPISQLSSIKFWLEFHAARQI